MGDHALATPVASSRRPQGAGSSLRGRGGASIADQRRWRYTAIAAAAWKDTH